MGLDKATVYEIITWSTVIGIILTAFTGFCRTPFLNLIGVSYWGIPFAWLKQVVYPGVPKEIVWQGLLLDVIIWVLFSGVALTLGMLYKKKRVNA